MPSRHVGAAALCAGLVAAATGCRSMYPVEESGIDFSGRLLVAVTPEQAERAARPPSVAARAADQSQDWRFQRVPTLPTTAAGRGGEAPRQWLIASPVEGRGGGAEAEDAHPWDLAHAALEARAPGRYATLMESLQRSAGEPITPRVIEPEVLPVPSDRLADAEGEQPGQSAGSTTEGNELTICDSPSPHWPKGKSFAWYMDDAHSELRSAREFVRAQRTQPRAGEGITIGILDTGYNDQHVTNPRGLDRKASRDFTEDPLRPAVGATDPYRTGPFATPGHGTGVLGVLAGGRVRAPDYDFDDDIGGDPDARIVMCRISDSVVHLRPTAMALAIKYAVAQGCDVINVCHGGLPSGMLADAVNEAYDNGTAIFAAAGDFVQIPFLRLSSPQHVVYPAAFDRVVAVTGITASGRSYSRKPGTWSLLRLSRWSEWMLRGSYGPHGAMEEALSAWTPNVPFACYSDDYPSNRVRLNGCGTSVATPQVAAAAALWLELHRHDPALESKWRSWEKAEAVYRALFASADRAAGEGDDAPVYFGRGALKARKALDVGVPADLAPRPRANVGFGWVKVWTELLPGVRRAARTEDEARLQAHLEMIRTETAQLVSGSAALQRRMQELGLEAQAKADADPAGVRALMSMVSRHPNCSRFLRLAIQKALAEAGGH
jgi:subtilisin family serine protease